jgi:hypothetical protein
MKILMETIFDDDEKIFSSICAGLKDIFLNIPRPLK